MTKDEAANLIDVYKKAWIEQNPELVLTIFTDGATYHDPHEPIARGRDEIRKYWIRKVLGEQKNISFTLLNLWKDGDTFIAEWEATFDSAESGERISLKEVAIFTASGSKFSSLREYYKSTKVPIS